MKSNISQITLVSLGAAFLLCAIVTAFSTPTINAISPAAQYFSINGLPVNQSQQPLTILSTEKIHFNGNDYILITYSDLSLKIVPLYEYQTTEIHVNVEDDNHNNDHHHETHHHKGEWSQADFDRKYGTSLPDDGTISDDDNEQHTTSTVHMVRPAPPQQQNDNTEDDNNSDETTDSDSGAESSDNGSSSDSYDNSGSSESDNSGGDSSDSGSSGDSGGSDGGSDSSGSSSSSDSGSD